MKRLRGKRDSSRQQHQTAAPDMLYDTNSSSQTKNPTKQRPTKKNDQLHLPRLLQNPLRPFSLLRAPNLLRNPQILLRPRKMARRQHLHKPLVLPDSNGLPRRSFLPRRPLFKEPHLVVRPKIPRRMVRSETQENFVIRHKGLHRGEYFSASR